MLRYAFIMTVSIFSTALSPFAHAPAALAEAARSAEPKIENFTLENGLEVVVIPDSRAPVVTHMIWYKVGSADEPKSKSGIAHFLEHLMFKGTQKYPAGMFSAKVSELGGQENAFTSYDYTAYYQRVPKEALKTLMEFEADRMTGLVLTDEVVNPERDVILEERRSRTDSDPSAQLMEAVSASLWLNHPYRLPIIGWEHEIRDLNRHDAIAFYKHFYRPNNAILVVAGDVDKETVRRFAEETYGTVERGDEIGPRQRPQEPPHITPRRVTLKDARVRQATLQRSYVAPSYSRAEGKQAHALDLLSTVLGGGSTSRLYKTLVIEQELAAAAGAYYSGTALDAGRFVVYAIPRPNVSLEKLEEALDQQIARILKEGVEASELERAKTRLVAQAIYERDNQASMARTFGASLTSGESVQDVLEWPDRVKAVTAEDIMEAGRQTLDLRRSVTGLLLPDATQSAEKP